MSSNETIVGGGAGIIIILNGGQVRGLEQGRVDAQLSVKPRLELQIGEVHLGVVVVSARQHRVPAHATTLDLQGARVLAREKKRRGRAVLRGGVRRLQSNALAQLAATAASDSRCGDGHDGTRRRRHCSVEHGVARGRGRPRVTVVVGRGRVRYLDGLTQRGRARSVMMLTTTTTTTTCATPTSFASVEIVCVARIEQVVQRRLVHRGRVASRKTGEAEGKRRLLHRPTRAVVIVRATHFLLRCVVFFLY